MKKYFTLPQVTGIISDPLGGRVGNVTVSFANSTYSTKTEYDGSYKAFVAPGITQMTFSKAGFSNITLDLSATLASSTEKDFMLKPMHPSLWYKFKGLLYNIKSGL